MRVMTGFLYILRNERYTLGGRRFFPLNERWCVLQLIHPLHGGVNS